MSPISSIIDGFASMSLPAILALIIFVGLLMFVSAASVVYVQTFQADRDRVHIKHARRRFQNNTDKEDFFDMVTRFRDEIPA